MNRKITYRQVIADYFYEYVRGANKGTISMSLLLAALCSYVVLCMNVGNGLACVPYLFAMISVDQHRLSLPYMMYLIPYSAEEREYYIQKMLHVKVLLPVLFCLVWDSVLLLFDSLSGYVFVLQLLSVFGVTYILGMLKNGNVQDMEEKQVYGSMKGYVGVLLVANQIVAGIMLTICMGEVSKLEFWIVMVVLLLIFLPMIIMIRKRWPILRSNFADYEMVMETEVTKCR